MRFARFLPPALVLAAAGCILTSGQISVTFDLGGITLSNADQVEAVFVNLNSIGEYKDHKENLKSLADLAILGEIQNNGATAVDVEFWITRDVPVTPLNPANVRGSGLKFWGPFTLAPGATARIDWDRSATLINDAGRDALLEEIEGNVADGAFTLYAIGPAGVTTYNVTIHDGLLLLVLDAGV